MTQDETYIEQLDAAHADVQQRIANLRAMKQALRDAVARLDRIVEQIGRAAA